MRTKRLPEEYDDLAPDGSEIRLLLNTERGGLCHCTLPPHAISNAVSHRTVQEIWYFVQGQGQVWRKQENREEVDHVEPGRCIDIPTGTHFQFRNVGEEPLRFLIVTMPPWPGEQEAVKVDRHWQVLGK